MTPQEIRARLIMKKVKQRQIAKRLGVTDGAVHQVIYGLETSRRIRQAIAEAIDLPESEVWPQKTA
jgi:predicted transcriptional regulator